MFSVMVPELTAVTAAENYQGGLGVRRRLLWIQLAQLSLKDAGRTRSCNLQPATVPSDKGQSADRLLSYTKSVR